MKTNKTSTKTSKVSEAATLPVSEKLLKESKPVKRTTMSSTAAKPASPATTAHKHSKAGAPAAAPVLEKAAPAKVVATPAPKSVPPPAPTLDEIARVAHSFWVERNFEHGFAELDWLRAEKVLRATAGK